MKILQHGDHNPFIVKCTRCGCKFQWNSGDLKMDSDDGNREPQYWVDCPECNLNIDVEPPPTPPSVKDDGIEFMDL